MADGSVEVKNVTMVWPIEVTLPTVACQADARNDVNEAHHWRPILVCVKNHVSAATTAPMATTHMLIGFASKAALNANCTAVAALVTALHAD